MSNISADSVKKLRELSGGAGFMECKKALVEANGELELAMEVLRKSGQAKAVKKASRVASEGVVVMMGSDDKKSAVLLELNCETDFVARESQFLAFGESLAKAILAGDYRDVAAISNDITLENQRQQLVQQLGENIALRRFVKHSVDSGDTGIVAYYCHGGKLTGRIGVLVHLSTSDWAVAYDVAMHAAAMNPAYIKQTTIPEEVMAKEKTLIMEQVKEPPTNKPEAVLEKIIAGKLQKWVKENTLYGQSFVKNPDLTVEKFLSSKNTDVLALARFEVGEGIEKREEDFRTEVFAQVKQNQ